jgi:hypothetical protein
MGNNENNEQPKSQTPESPEPVESKPQARTWQEYATKMLNFLKDWFFKLKPTYKIMLIIFSAGIIVVILLAYLGVFGQEVSDLIKQLVNKILEQIKAKKS